jgi:uncharacterized small protein (DUF1192 family)
LWAWSPPWQRSTKTTGQKRRYPTRSGKELDERIALLQGEIARLEANRIGKQASRQTADQFFKK